MKTAFVILSLVLFAVCANAQGRGHDQVPTITAMDCAPATPTLPSQYTVAFTEYITAGILATGPDPYYADGYIYIDFDAKMTRADAAFPGGMTSTIFDYNTHTAFISSMARGNFECSTSAWPIPMPSQDMMENFDFVGVATVPGSGICTVWEGSIGPFAIQLFFDQEGVPVLEVTDSVAMYFFGFTDVVDENVFIVPSQCSTDSVLTTSMNALSSLKLGASPSLTGFSH